MQTAVFVRSIGRTLIPGIAEISLVQEDGALPTIWVEGSAPGESGVSILSMQFEGGVHFRALPRQHLIWFQLSDVRIECRRAARKARQHAPPGSLAICPAGIDCAADANESADAIVVSVDPSHLSLAAADDATLDVRLHERWLGFDQALLDLARTMVLESARGYPEGALFWNEIASDFIAGLFARHSSALDSEGLQVPGSALQRAACSRPVWPRSLWRRRSVDRPVATSVLGVAGRADLAFL